jgi:hypothetical protein
MMSSRFAFGAFLAAVFLAACGGQPGTGAPSTAVQPATRSLERSLHGYYLTKFTTVVGRSPAPSLCFRFMSSGRWYSTGTPDFSGTYLSDGKELFASAAWPSSPVVYMSLQGSVNAKQGSGQFIVSGEAGNTTGGGTFTMTREQGSSCS